MGFIRSSVGTDDGDDVPAWVEEYNVLAAFLFIGSLWLFGKIFGCFHGKLIGEILVGFILGGPGMLEIIPDEEGWKLIGEMGLTLLVIEGGTHVDLESLKKIGPVSLAIGASGTIASILVSWLIISLLLGFSTLSGISSGVALASTSIGMANTLLKEHDFLNTMLGRTVAAAAVVDDVLPLVLLAVLRSLSELMAVQGDEGLEFLDTLWALVKPVVASIFVVIMGWGISVCVPKIYSWWHQSLSTKKGICPWHKASHSGSVPEYPPPPLPQDVANEANEGETVFYHGNDEGVIPEKHVFMQTMYSFNAFDEGQLAFEEGEVIEVIEFHPSGWWLGRISQDRIGRFPKAYCDVLNQEKLEELCPNANTSRTKEEMREMADLFEQRVEEQETNEEETPSQHPLSYSRQMEYDLSVLGGLLVYGVLFAAFASAIYSTPLLGCFMAGVAFAKVERTQELWHAHISPMLRWMISIFFASVGFEIPGRELIRADLVVSGLLFTVPSIFTKLLTGFFVRTDFPLDAFIIGWAMVGRGELGFLMAETAKMGGILEPDAFIITVWALVLSTFIAPFLFDYYLRKKRKKELASLSTTEMPEKEEEPPVEP